MPLRGLQTRSRSEKACVENREEQCRGIELDYLKERVRQLFALQQAPVELPMRLDTQERESMA